MQDPFLQLIDPLLFLLTTLTCSLIVSWLKKCTINNTESNISLCMKSKPDHGAGIGRYAQAARWAGQAFPAPTLALSKQQPVACLQLQLRFTSLISHIQPAALELELISYPTQAGRQTLDPRTKSLLLVTGLELDDPGRFPSCIDHMLISTDHIDRSQAPLLL